MYRHKLTQVRPKSANAQRLQRLMLEYHDFRLARRDHHLAEAVSTLGQWQAKRLRHTHRDLYQSPRYQAGLDFLLDDLYAPREFSRRDDDFERIFPTMVRLLPGSALHTLAELVELNLISQKMDLAMAEALQLQLNLGPGDIPALTGEQYGRAYRFCGDHQMRLRQIQLVSAIGTDLERYVSNRALRMALRATERPAEMAGLGELHRFIREGCRVFRTMDGVDELLDQVVERETWILEQMLAGNPLPETLPPHLNGQSASSI